MTKTNNNIENELDDLFLSADKNKRIEQLTKQHMQYGLSEERARHYATNEVDNEDYDKFITTVRRVFVGEK